MQGLCHLSRVNIVQSLNMKTNTGIKRTFYLLLAEAMHLLQAQPGRGGRREAFIVIFCAVCQLLEFKLSGPALQTFVLSKHPAPQPSMLNLTYPVRTSS